MRLRSWTVLMLCGLLFSCVSPTSNTTPPRSQQVSQAQDWTGLATAIRARAEWFAASTGPATRIVIPPRASSARYGTGACGGDLPPCSVMWCESHGNLTAQNPRSTASGKWQILDSTWAGYGGYSRAMYAPESVQDERARQIYAGGAGRSQWMC